MIISDTKEFIFIHNPKCAGTTVRLSLHDYDTRGNNFWMHSDVYGKKIDKAHMTLNILNCGYPEVIKDMSKYFVFGFVRNPLTRVISAFNETHQKLLNDASDDLKKRDEYIRSLNEFCSSLNRNNTKGWSFPYRHCVQQKHMFYFNKKNKADLIMKTEDLNVEIDKLNVLLPCLSEVSNTWIKNIKNKKNISFDARECLTKKTIGIIQDTYSEDYEIFGYKK